jgi:glycosyltransferase involved in cell wall biosynthesis
MAPWVKSSFFISFFLNSVILSNALHYTMKKSNFRIKTNSLHLCLISCFPPSKGPLSEYTYHLVKHLSGSPLISKLTILADKVNEEEIFLHEKIEIKRCWNLNDVFTPLNILITLRKLKPDLVYFNLVFRHFSANRFKNFVGLITPAITKLLNVPVVVTLHSIVEAVNLDNIGYRNSRINKFGYQLATKLILRSDMVTLTHKRLVEIIKEEYGHSKNIIYVPHGVFEEPISSTNFEGKRLLLFGKMGQYKNPALAIEAFQEVMVSFKDAELIIGGSSHPLEPSYLEALIERYKGIPNVKFTGYIPERDLESTFTSCIAVLLPYSSSVWSSAVFILACIYGRPVIASNLPDFQELHQEGAGIILFPTGNKRALVKAMELILSNKDLQKKLGDANLQWAKRNRFDQVINKLIEVFYNVVRKDFAN